MDEVIVRSYQPSDLSVIQKIHEESSIDYALPNISKLIVNKVLEVNGVPRASLGMAPCLEDYLWMDSGAWTDAVGKWAAIKVLEREATDAANSLGVSNIFCCIPPGYDRFGKRIKELGFSPLRNGWKIFAKQAGDTR